MTETYCEDCNGEGLYETTNPTNGLQDSWKCNACAGSGMGPAPSSDWLDVIENRLKSPHTSFFFGGQPMDHVFSEVEVDRLVSEVKRLRAENERLRVNALINTQQLKLPQIVQLQADRWDEGYTFGRLMQFDADNHEVAQTGPARNARKSLVANLDWARGRNRDNPYREETP